MTRTEITLRMGMLRFKDQDHVSRFFKGAMDRTVQNARWKGPLIKLNSRLESIISETEKNIPIGIKNQALSLHNYIKSRLVLLPDERISTPSTIVDNKTSINKSILKTKLAQLQDKDSISLEEQGIEIDEHEQPGVDYYKDAQNRDVVRFRVDDMGERDDLISLSHYGLDLKENASLIEEVLELPGRSRIGIIVGLVQNGIFDSSKVEDLLEFFSDKIIDEDTLELIADVCWQENTLEPNINSAKLLDVFKKIACRINFAKYVKPSVLNYLLSKDIETDEIVGLLKYCCIDESLGEHSAKDEIDTYLRWKPHCKNLHEFVRLYNVYCKNFSPDDFEDFNEFLDWNYSKNSD